MAKIKRLTYAAVALMAASSLAMCSTDHRPTVLQVERPTAFD